MSTITHLDRGCYEASRAAALSGVPERTVYWWADRGIVAPSVSPEREKLWSYGDLLTLRLVDWLRKPKGEDQGGSEIARSSMREIRALLERSAGSLWSVDAGGAERPTILVGIDGRIYLEKPLETVEGQGALELLDLIAPFSNGPDLRRPRPHLRIVPGKVAGEPHLAHSRLTTRAVAALKRRGFTVADIADMYHEDPQALAEALDLEAQLTRAA